MSESRRPEHMRMREAWFWIAMFIGMAGGGISTAVGIIYGIWWGDWRPAATAAVIFVTCVIAVKATEE